MAPAKRNLRPRYRKDEMLSNRRSSLQVNLSFVSSLSDSGNGSLKSHVESNEAGMGTKICKNRHDALSNILEHDNSRLAPNTDVLSTIRSKEQALNHSCELLRDAILHKTREIFDQKAELAVRTTNVLKGQRKALKEISNDSASVKLCTESMSAKDNSVKTSPHSKRSLIKRKSKSDTKIIPKSVERASKGDVSVILSGSSKSHRKTLSRINDKVLKVRLTRIPDPRLQVSLESSESSQSSVLDDIGAPITCSSFISGYERSDSRVSQRTESEGRESCKDSDVEDAAAPSVQTLTPTEITAVHVPVLSSKKKLTRLNSISDKIRTLIEKTSNLNDLTQVSMELTPVQSHIQSRNSTGSTNTVRASLNVNTSVNESPCSPPKKICHEASFARRKSSSQLSLRVNTSLRTESRSPAQEIVISNDKGNNSLIENIEESGENCNGNNTDPMEDMSLIARLRNISRNKATDGRKSNGRSRNSLGEGPSFVDGTPFHRKNGTDAETPRKSNKSGRSSLGSFVEGTPYPPSRSFLWKTQLKSATFNTMRNRTAGKAVAPLAPPKKLSEASDSDSSVDTEYLTAPNATVVLGDSPSRFTPATGNTQIIPDSSDEEKLEEVAKTKGETVKDLSNDISEKLLLNSLKDVLDNFPMGSSGELPNSHPKETSRELSKDKSNKNSSENTTRSRKKKLFTMQEDYELVSFSPLSPAVPVKPAPKQNFVMRKRRIQKRKAVRAIAAKRIESMREDDEDELVPGCSLINNIFTENKNKKLKKPRKIISKKIIVKKIVGLDIMQELESRGRNCSERESAARRDSLNDFSKKETLPLSGRNTRTQKLVIVATGFTKGDVDLVKKVLKELGGAEFSSTVSRRTTHVVSTGVRTINLLRGIIRGCWLVSIDWVLKSLEEHKWLNAEEYEMAHFSKAVQENRRDRQLFGKAYVPELFVTCGPIYIEHGTTPLPCILKELIKTAGGRITENARDSKISIGPAGLREIWVLDSITTGDLQPIEDYQRR